MKTIMFAFFLMIAMCPVLSVAEGNSVSAKGTIVVMLEDLKNSKGNVLVTLYDQEKGFPGKPEKAIAKKIKAITEKKAQVVFEDVPFGEYAISAMHDENDNQKMDSNFFGMPTEGVGASNDAKGSFGPPKYQDAAFQMDSETKELIIHMKYIF